LNDVSHSSKPAALSPQSAALADAIPIVAAATIENNTFFQALSRIRRRSRNIIMDLETAKRKTELQVGGIGPFMVIESGERALAPPIRRSPHHSG
jgi:topoisomerase IA-like protein